MRRAWVLLASACSLFAAVSGTVTNATSGKPQAGVIVSLIQPSQTGMETLGSVKSDAAGAFVFKQDAQPPVLLQAIYQGVTYTQVLQPGQPVEGVDVKVFDASNKKGVAKVNQHMVLIEPGAQSLEVAETFIVENQTNTTFQDAAHGSVEFFLPDAAGGKATVAIRSQSGMPIERPAEKTAVKNIFKVDYPVKPGETRFDVSYSLPAGDTFSSKIMHGEGLTRLVTPSTVTLAGTGIEEMGQEPQTKAHIYNATAAAYTVKISGTGSLRQQSAQTAQTNPEDDPGEPQIEEKAARIYSRIELVFGFTFAILALGGLLLYRKTA